MAHDSAINPESGCGAHCELWQDPCGIHAPCRAQTFPESGKEPTHTKRKARSQAKLSTCRTSAQFREVAASPSSFSTNPRALFRLVIVIGAIGHSVPGTTKDNFF